MKSDAAIAAGIRLLRDVTFRIEDGECVQAWCVLPEDQHDHAVRALVTLAHRTIDPECPWPSLLYTNSVDGEGIEAGWQDEKDEYLLHDITVWLVDRSGRMLTITRHPDFT